MIGHGMKGWSEGFFFFFFFQAWCFTVLFFNCVFLSPLPCLVLLPFQPVLALLCSVFCFHHLEGRTYGIIPPTHIFI